MNPDKSERVAGLIQAAMKQKDLSKKYHQKSMEAIELANEYIREVKRIIDEDLGKKERDS